MKKTLEIGTWKSKTYGKCIYSRHLQASINNPDINDIKIILH